MFDELAMEKRIRWDPKTNYFLGLCREHAHRTSTEFVNEGDMEELFQKLNEEKVHYAKEVRVDCFRRGIFQSGTVPDLLLGNCWCSWCLVQG